ncbi:hypothetical protein GUJ93_ZPchr0008g12585 [Zizania palustris]|uniref:Uncharacterized protein n=1 Tax=Zizania palustris TaxID=103762 RepID=A0A8J5QYM7_ZIZPA|nr:hypothetical protein GUJ93_ZPchr0008g12585 [Zizania palustris]
MIILGELRAKRKKELKKDNVFKIKSQFDEANLRPSEVQKTILCRDFLNRHYGVCWDQSGFLHTLALLLKILM